MASEYDVIEKLCHEYTDLTDEDIKIIRNEAENLDNMFSDTACGIDYFIDCPCSNGTSAVVVAQAKSISSLYSISTIGAIVEEDYEPAVFRSLKLGIDTEGVKADTLADAQKVVQTVYPIKNGNLTIGVTISERVYIESDGKVSESKVGSDDESTDCKFPFLQELKCTWEAVHDGLVLIDCNDTIIYRNNIAVDIYKKYGYVNDIIGKKYRKVACHAELSDDNPITEIVIKGSAYTVRRNECHMFGDDYVLMVMHDITDKRMLIQSEKIRTAFISEAHHRVKNSLNMIYSLLDMQARRSNNPEVREGLVTAMNRIISIANVYDVNGKSSSEKISLFQVLMQTREYYMQAAMQEQQNIEVLINGKDISVGIDTATVIMLVVNELTQNAYKHAFKNKEDGTITIRIMESNEEDNRDLYPRILVEDNGEGFDIDARDTTGIGYRIVKMLVKEKLKGTLSIKSTEKGTKASFSFRTE